MKKNYTAPKAEIREFNYSETVAASRKKSLNEETHYTDANDEGAAYCRPTETYHVAGDV